MQDFVNAADCYEQLTYLNPEVEDYRLYYAQSLYKACLYEESMKVSCQIDTPGYQTKVELLLMQTFSVYAYQFACTCTSILEV